MGDMKIYEIGYIISSTAFWVLVCFLFWGYFEQKQSGDLGRDGSVPAILVGSAEKFRLGYKSELFDNKSLEIENSEAWRKLNGDLAAYAKHHELLRKQQRIMRRIVVWGYFLSGLFMSYFVVRKVKAKKACVN